MTICFSLAALSSVSAQGAARIHLNQVGYHPAAPKIAVVVDSLATRFAVVRAGTRDTVLRGTLTAPARWAPSRETVRTADFSRLTSPGRYRVVVPGVGASHAFAIDTLAYRELARAAIKAFYFQRASTALPTRYAARWARAAGHPDTAVLVHPSAATTERPAGTRIRAPGGWYDAGDYNKYVVNSGISTYTLLAIVEHFPAYARGLETTIPESGDGVPDVMDEALWNLRWMLSMQDPHDGGVYHKLTNAEFDGMVMPGAATRERWVVQKSTAATLDFAATAAYASSVLHRHGARALGDSLWRASLAAWDWARAQPASVYDQARMNATHRPEVVTGAYGDSRLQDERTWAAWEMFAAARTRGVESDSVPGALDLTEPPSVPDWSSVGTLGLIAALRVAHDHEARDLVLRYFLPLPDTLVARRRASPYGVAMVERDFVWGSSAVAANQGMMLVQAYRSTGDSAYLHAASTTLDYLLGTNPTGYSFVTGFGSRPPMYPHHRPSEADGIDDPIPGMLVGGPNPGKQDNCPGYPSTLPALAYVDSVCSYASNEIAINWNAPLAYLAAALDALRSDANPMPARRD